MCNKDWSTLDIGTVVSKMHSNEVTLLFLRKGKT